MSVRNIFRNAAKGMVRDDNGKRKDKTKGSKQTQDGSKDKKKGHCGSDSKITEGSHLSEEEKTPGNENGSTSKAKGKSKDKTKGASPETEGGNPGDLSGCDNQDNALPSGTDGVHGHVPQSSQGEDQTSDAQNVRPQDPSCSRRTDYSDGQNVDSTDESQTADDMVHDQPSHSSVVPGLAQGERPEVKEPLEPRGPVQEITGIEPTTTDNQDGGVREDNDPIYQDPRLFKETVIGNKEIQDRLTRPLNRAHRVIKNWEHLACTENIKAPLETRLRCRLNAEYSPTERLMDILAAEKGDTELQEFVKVLGKSRSPNERGMEREDVVKIIKEYYPDAENSTKSIRDSVASNPELIEKMATELEQKSPTVKNWEHLGRAFSISEDRLKEIKYRHNPTYAVMEYNFSSDEPMTVKTFREIMEDFKRGDVVKIIAPYLQGSGNEKMSDVVPLDSDTMRKICICLNNPHNAPNDWKRLAGFLKIDREIYNVFNPNDLKSPTTLLFDWISSAKPEFTVGQLCCALKEIKRFDLVTDVKKNTYNRLVTDGWDRL